MAKTYRDDPFDQSQHCPAHGWVDRRVKDRKCVICHDEETRTKRPQKRLENLPQDLWNNARKRCDQERKKFGDIPFTITVEDVKKVFPRDGKCPILDVPFSVLSASLRNSGSSSIKGDE